MRRVSFRFLLPIFAALVLFGCSLPGQKATLLINILNAEPAEVFLDGKSIGSTPLQKEDVKPGSYEVKIVPKDATKQPYSTRLGFVAGQKTKVNWELAATVDESSGDIYEPKPASGKDTVELTVITIPDSAIVRIDGESRGLAPLSLQVAPGSKDIQISASSYKERRISPVLEKGVSQQITVKLATDRGLTPLATPLPTPMATATPTATTSASSPKPSVTPRASATPSPRPSATPVSSGTATSSATSSTGIIQTTGTPPLPYVEVKQTEQGWLRVRDGSSATSTELAKLAVGSKVPYLNQTVNGWHKVEYKTGKEGWVSGQYAVVTDR